MTRFQLRPRVLLAGMLLGLGCSSPPPEPPPAPKKGAAAAGANAMLNPEARGGAVAAATAGKAGAAPAPAALPTDIKKKVLKDEDFVESVNNRDPFHPFIN